MITFLKLGGSLITDKDQPHTAREAALQRVGQEIHQALRDAPELRLILGHGSGSFGHVPARRYKTREGVFTREDWQGFAEVHSEAAALNQLTVKTLRGCGVPCLSFSPQSSVLTDYGKVVRWDTKSLQIALQNGLVPVVYGDTIFDKSIGGTILSTEDLFSHLARTLAEPAEILLAGIEPGVWSDYPRKTVLIDQLDISHFADSQVEFIQRSASTDVTGGMRSKVSLMADLLSKHFIQKALIFSGADEGNVYNALMGKHPGTLLTLAPEGKTP